MALRVDGKVDKKKLEKELSAALDEDYKYHKTDAMKKRAIHNAKSYDEFRHMVACATLKPVNRQEMESLGQSSKGWQYKNKSTTNSIQSSTTHLGINLNLPSSKSKVERETQEEEEGERENRASEEGRGKGKGTVGIKKSGKERNDVYENSSPNKNGGKGSKGALSELNALLSSLEEKKERKGKKAKKDKKETKKKKQFSLEEEKSKNKNKCNEKDNMKEKTNRLMLKSGMEFERDWRRLPVKVKLKVIKKDMKDDKRIEKDDSKEKQEGRQKKTNGTIRD